MKTNKLKKALAQLSANLWGARVGLFSQRDNLKDSYDYINAIATASQDATAVNAAAYVHHNTLLKVVTDMIDELVNDTPDENECGISIIDSSGKTKGELAKELYPNMVIDCAVPQAIIDKLYERGFKDPAAHLVTVYIPVDYNKNNTSDVWLTDGTVMPITDYGIHMMAVIASHP